MNAARLTGTVALVVAIELIAACSGDNPIGPIVPPPPPPPPPPVITGPESVSALVPDAPQNVLTARVVFTVATKPDSVKVLYQESGGVLERSPAFTVKAGSDTIQLLGFKAATRYTYEVDAFTGGVGRSSPSSTFLTSPLPDALADVKLVKISGSTSRYTATGIQTSSGSYAVVFDSTGAITWYHDFTSTGLQVSDVMMQPNGNFTAYIGNSAGFQAVPGYYVEVTPGGEEVREYHAPTGYYMDDHEIRITGSGATSKAHYLTYDIRSVDLTDIGGNSVVQTAGHQIVRENANGTIEFNWDAWNNIDLDEWLGDDQTKQTRTATDFDHPNAISFDLNGNYIVSWRNLDQIMAIDAQTGDILWRLGGKKSDYQFVNDPLDGFRKQHSPKILPNGNLLVFDNGTGHDPQESRAVEYRLDPITKTATLVWEYRHTPAIYAAFVGWVERLTNGSTWVAFALAGRVVEVTPSGDVTWEAQLSINGANGSVYRLLPITSLYGYLAP